MKKELLKWLIAMLILLFTSCYDLPTNTKMFKREISIIGILDTSNQSQKIYAYYTSKPDENTESIQNALVQVYNNNQNINFHLYKDTLDYPIFFFSDRPETLHVIPEIKYHLKLATDEGDSVTGETTVPGMFKISTPVSNSSIKISRSLLIEWSKSKSAYGYIINLINPPTEYPPGSGHLIYHSPECFQTNDTTYTIYRDYGFKKGKYAAKVMAYDENYHYHHAEGISSCGVFGGYGVFASAVIDSVSFSIE